MVLGQAGSFGGLTLSESYTKRLQPNELTASSSAGTVIDLAYCFYALVSGACPTTATNDNGDVMAIVNKLNSARTQTFAYDALNRINTAQTQGTSGSNCFGFQFGYDAWANLTATSILSGYTSCTATTPDAFGISVDGNNHLTTSGFSYDGSGNVLNDGINSYAWNAESETKTAAGVNYIYDGLGNRVEKANGTLYWYGPGGVVLDETNLTGSLTSEYVFFGGKRVARRDASGNIYYYAEDFIGSSRVITQSNGTLCSDADFLPFGQEVDYTSGCAQNYKFEGKERDIETGNDNFGARYYRSALGRWMSPDWSAVPAPVPYANLTNPQTLNLYAMTTDNPETFADLDGHLGGILEPIATNPNGLSPDMEVDSGAYEDQFGNIILSAPPSTPLQATGPVNNPTGAELQLSQQGLNFIENWEGGFHSHAYDASGKKHLGDWTIGYGHKILPNEKFSKGITKEQALVLLHQDVQVAVTAVNKLVEVPLKQNEFDALVSFTFALGASRFSRSMLRVDVNGGGVPPLHDFTMFSFQSHQYVRGLANRRRAEYQLYIGDRYLYSQ